MRCGAARVGSVPDALCALDAPVPVGTQGSTKESAADEPAGDDCGTVHGVPSRSDTTHRLVSGTTRRRAASGAARDSRWRRLQTLSVRGSARSPPAARRAVGTVSPNSVPAALDVFGRGAGGQPAAPTALGHPLPFIRSATAGRRWHRRCRQAPGWILTRSAGWRGVGWRGRRCPDGRSPLRGVRVWSPARWPEPSSEPGRAVGKGSARVERLPPPGDLPELRSSCHPK
jgi:hypothetical protein